MGDVVSRIEHEEAIIMKGEEPKCNKLVIDEIMKALGEVLDAEPEGTAVHMVGVNPDEGRCECWKGDEGQ